jgi:hypothetical protein
MESVADIMTKGQIVTCTPETSIDDGVRATPPGGGRFAADEQQRRRGAAE